MNVTSERHLKCGMKKDDDGSEDVCSSTTAIPEQCRGLKGVMREEYLHQSIDAVHVLMEPCSERVRVSAHGKRMSSQPNG